MKFLIIVMTIAGTTHYVLCAVGTTHFITCVVSFDSMRQITFQIRELRLTEVEKLAQGYRAPEWVGEQGSEAEHFNS